MYSHFFFLFKSFIVFTSAKTLVGRLPYCLSLFPGGLFFFFRQTIEKAGGPLKPNTSQEQILSPLIQAGSHQNLDGKFLLPLLYLVVFRLFAHVPIPGLIPKVSIIVCLDQFLGLLIFFQVVRCQFFLF